MDLLASPSIRSFLRMILHLLRNEHNSLVNLCKSLKTLLNLCVHHQPFGWFHSLTLSCKTTMELVYLHAYFSLCPPLTRLREGERPPPCENLCNSYAQDAHSSMQILFLIRAIDVSSIDAFGSGSFRRFGRGRLSTTSGTRRLPRAVSISGKGALR